MSLDRFLMRLAELFKEDPELRLSILDMIAAKTKADLALADWRNRRK